MQCEKLLATAQQERIAACVRAMYRKTEPTRTNANQPELISGTLWAAMALPAHSNNPEVRAGRFPNPSTQPQLICPHCQRHLLEFQPIDKLMSVDAAAEFYAVHPHTVRNWIDKGYIRAFKLTPDSKIIRVPMVDFLRLADRFGSKVSITHAKRKSGKHPASQSKAQEADGLRNEGVENK